MIGYTPTTEGPIVWARWTVLYLLRTRQRINFALSQWQTVN